jgi:MFS family permease
VSQALGVDRLFLATAATFVIAAVLTMTLPSLPLPSRLRQDAAAHPLRAMLRDVQEGLVFIRQDPILTKAIAYLTVATTTFMLVAALAPQFVANVVGLPSSQIGYLVAPAGIGVILGVAIVPALVQRVPRALVVDWAFVIGGAALFLLATSRIILETILTPDPVPLMMEIVVAGVLAAILGVSNALILVPSQTILQERSHEHIRARVYATFFTVTSVVSFVPIFFAAAAADLFGVVAVLAMVALLLVGAGAISVVRAERERRARHARVRTRHRQGPEAIPPPG